MRSQRWSCNDMMMISSEAGSISGKSSRTARHGELAWCTAESMRGVTASSACWTGAGREALAEEAAPLSCCPSCCRASPASPATYNEDTVTAAHNDIV